MRFVCFYLLFVLVVLSLFASLTVGQFGCQSIAISVGKIDNCVDGECKTEIVANVAIDLKANRVACLNLYSGDVFLGSVNISALSIFKTQVAEYCYYSDDPLIERNIICKCSPLLLTPTPGCSGHPTQNGQCPFIPRGKPNYQFCQAGFAEKGDLNDCVFGGYYCIRTNLYVNKRFKICKLSDPDERKVVLDVVTDREHLTITYNDKVTTYTTEDKELVVSLPSVSVDEMTYSKYVVWDKTSPTDFWYLDSDKVNDFKEYGNNKVGYIVADDQHHELQTLLDNEPFLPVAYTVYGCYNYDTEFLAKLNFRTNSEVLRDLDTKRVVKNNYPRYLSDSEYDAQVYQNYPAPLQTNTEYWFIKEGLISYRKNNPAILSFLGLTMHDIFVPLVYNTVNETIRVRIRDGTIKEMNNAWLHCVFVADWRVNSSSCYQACFARTPNSMTEYGLCSLNSCESATIETRMLNCVDPEVYAVTWPDMRRAIFRMDQTGEKGIQTEYDDRVQTTTRVVSNFKGANILVNLKMNNLTVRFQNYHVTPVITDCSFYDGSIVFTLYTLDGSAAVIVTFSDPALASMSPVIGMEKQKLSKAIPFTLNSEVLVTVVNGKHSSTCTVNVNSNINLPGWLSSWDFSKLPKVAATFLENVFSLFGLNLPDFSGKEIVSSVIFWLLVVVCIFIGIGLLSGIMFILVLIAPYLFTAAEFLFMTLLPVIETLFMCCLRKKAVNTAVQMATNAIALPQTLPNVAYMSSPQTLPVVAPMSSPQTAVSTAVQMATNTVAPPQTTTSTPPSFTSSLLNLNETDTANLLQAVITMARALNKNK